MFQELFLIDYRFNLGGAPVHVMGSLKVKPVEAGEIKRMTGAVDANELAELQKDGTQP